MMNAEILKRFKLLNLWEEAVKAYKKEKVCVSMRGGCKGLPIGVIYEVPSNWENLIKEVEERIGGKVYHVIHSVTEFGELLDFIYVSEKDTEMWECEDYDIMTDKILFSCCVNFGMPNGDISEKELSLNEAEIDFGTIQVKECGGGLIRVA